MDSVLIVVLNWNNLADTEQCLASLHTQSYPDFTILLVDNGSTEHGTNAGLERFAEQYGKQLVILRNKQNKGFAGGVNTGIRYALELDFTYVALVNNDAVITEDWLETLVATSKKENSSLTTGLLLHEDGKTIDSTGDWYTTWGLPFPRGRNNPTKEAPKGGAVFGVSGGGSLYTTSLFRDIGLFDETFFAYYEDVDVSFRALLAGHTAYYEPRAVAYHKQCATSRTIPGFAMKQTLKNLPLLFIKNVPTSMLVSIGVRFWLAYILIAGKAILSRNIGPALSGLLQGVWLFWTHGLPERFRIQQHRRVASRKVSKLLWRDLPPDQTGLRKLLRRPVQ